MISLKAGVDNVVNVAVESTIDIAGFTATLTIGSLTKTIADLSGASPKLEFSAADVEAVGDEPCYGVLQVMDTDGKLYLEMRPEFRIIEANDNDAQWVQTLYMTVVGDFTTVNPWGGGDTPTGD